MNYFSCVNCDKKVSLSAIGTENRNHCPYCLWSMHLDRNLPGDRQANCGGNMEPIGLAYKSEGSKKQGEICVVHHCLKCNHFSKNRIAGDDEVNQILAIYQTSFDRNPTENIELLDSKDADEVITQLFGKPNLEKYRELLK